MDLATVFSKLGETWPARAGQAVWNAAKLPGDVYQGNIPVMPPGLRREDFTDAAPPQAAPGSWLAPVQHQPNDELVGRATDLAGALGSGGIPMAERGAVGIFGGRLAKTADLQALQRAEQAARAGVDPRKIWSDTGWAQGAEGKWRFEIPDNALTVGFGSGKGVSGPGSAIQHDALAEAYPSLADMSHTIGPGRRSEGSFFKEYAPGTSDRIPASAIVSATDLAQARSMAAHELQHGVQQIEGFTSGGNPAEFHRAFLPADASASYTEALPMSAYRHLAGEVEARNVQSRLDMPPNVKAMAEPRLTEDINRRHQIVRGSDGEIPDIATTLADLASRMRTSR